MKDVALVGLPYCGKSTVFAAVTRSHAQAGATNKANVAIVHVGDERLDRLAAEVKAEKVNPARFRLIDVAGMSGQGMTDARSSHALAVVLNAFASDPAKDWENFRVECAVADLSTLEKGIERVQKKLKSGDKTAVIEDVVYRRGAKALEEGRWLADESWEPEERRALELVGPLTLKLTLPIVNVDEAWDGITDGFPAGAVVVRGLLEAEAADLSPEDAAELMSEFGVDSSATSRVVDALFQLLDLIVFFTGNEVEARAWEITRGTKAPVAAGTVHGDFEKGFIRWEAVEFEDFMSLGSWDAAKGAGKLRAEGKDYVVRDGDVVRILHS